MSAAMQITQTVVASSATTKGSGVSSAAGFPRTGKTRFVSPAKALQSQKLSRPVPRMAKGVSLAKKEGRGLGRPKVSLADESGDGEGAAPASEEEYAAELTKQFADSAFELEWTFEGMIPDKSKESLLPRSALTGDGPMFVASKKSGLRFLTKNMAILQALLDGSVSAYIESNDVTGIRVSHPLTVLSQMPGCKALAGEPRYEACPDVCAEIPETKIMDANLNYQAVTPLIERELDGRAIDFVSRFMPYIQDRSLLGKSWGEFNPGFATVMGGSPLHWMYNHDLLPTGGWANPVELKGDEKPHQMDKKVVDRYLPQTEEMLDSFVVFNPDMFTMNFIAAPKRDSTSNKMLKASFYAHEITDRPRFTINAMGKLKLRFASVVQ